MLDIFIISQLYDLWWAWTQSWSLTTIKVSVVWELLMSHYKLWELELCESEWSFYLFPAHLYWPCQLNMGFSLASSTFLIGKVNYIQARMTRENQNNLTEILTIWKIFYFPLYLISLLVWNNLVQLHPSKYITPCKECKQNNNCWNYFLIENHLEKEMYTIISSCCG